MLNVLRKFRGDLNGVLICVDRECPYKGGGQAFALERSPCRIRSTAASHFRRGGAWPCSLGLEFWLDAKF